jgi:peptidyl-prolyl cis-trans isomerase B (cyclophilin B)
MKKSLTALALIAVALFNSCAQKSNGPKDTIVTIKTEFGDMVAVLYDETPKHKENFIKLAKEGYFDGMLFHRVIQEFMIQGGDPDSKTATKGQQLGQGGPGYEIDAEFNPKFYHVKGALSAARTSDQINPMKKSSGSQFYIVQGSIVPAAQLEYDQSKLNTGFTMMFQMPENKPTLDSLMALRNSGDVNGYNAMIVKLIPRVEKATGITIKTPEERVKDYSTVGGAPHLDGEYTVFGRVIQGLEVIDKIAAQPTEQERPLQDIKMTVEVKEMSREEVTGKYGYQYPASN